MELSNEEMESLNRSSEILSKYAAIGGLTQLDFAYYERMVIAIIDKYGENEHYMNSSKLDKTKKSLSIEQLCSLLNVAIKIRKYFQTDW